MLWPQLCEVLYDPQAQEVCVPPRQGAQTAQQAHLPTGPQCAELTESCLFVTPTEL